jgi:hypothetical protein
MKITCGRTIYQDMTDIGNRSSFCHAMLMWIAASRYLIRKPSSFTPSPVNGPYGGKSLILGDDRDKDHASIAQVRESPVRSYCACSLLAAVLPEGAFIHGAVVQCEAAAGSDGRVNNAIPALHDSSAHGTRTRTLSTRSFWGRSGRWSTRSWTARRPTHSQAGDPRSAGPWPRSRTWSRHVMCPWLDWMDNRCSRFLPSSFGIISHHGVYERLIAILCITPPVSFVVCLQ